VFINTLVVRALEEGRDLLSVANDGTVDIFLFHGVHTGWNQQLEASNQPHGFYGILN